MEDCERTLVVFLSMHRCGSSLATNILYRMGMSLGPFELMGAAPTNPHGHFEAIPFYNLNRRVQDLAFGFSDDLPESPKAFSRFWQTQGEWPAETDVPDELLEEGRSLICALVDSGQVSGFKDPRTVLTWPFWERVLKDLPGLHVIPVSLLRSPHEIAMSLVTRRNGWCGYWTSLDVVAIHLRRQKAILESAGMPSRSVCFGSPSFLETLVEVVHQCGLQWNAAEALAAIDPSCVHQVPAAVEHEAQDLFETLCGEPRPPGREPEQNRRQLTNDARFLESLRLTQWQSVRDQVSEVQLRVSEEQHRVSEEQQRTRQTQTRAELLGQQLQEAEARLLETRSQLLANQQELIENQRVRVEMQERLIVAQAESIQIYQHNEALRSRLERFESHPLLGPALRIRRRMRQTLATPPESSTNGHVSPGP